MSHVSHFSRLPQLHALHPLDRALDVSLDGRHGARQVARGTVTTRGLEGPNKFNKVDNSSLL